MNYYITQENGYNWHTVIEGPFSTIDEVTNAVRKMAMAVSSEHDALILSACSATASNKRIRKGKNINRAWITVQNKLTEVEDFAMNKIVNDAINAHIATDSGFDWDDEDISEEEMKMRQEIGA